MGVLVNVLLCLRDVPLPLGCCVCVCCFAVGGVVCWLDRLLLWGVVFVFVGRLVVKALGGGGKVCERVG